MAIFYKRLEQGTFRFGVSGSGKLEMSAPDLQLVLQGIVPAKVERTKRYTRPDPKRPSDTPVSV